MSIVIRKGTAKDLDAFADLLLEVRQGMANPEWFCVDPREVLRAQMESGMMELWLAMDGQRIAGALDILIPGLDPVNYGYELQLSPEELLRVVNMDSVAVHPDYRGRGLQRVLLAEAERWLGQDRDRILLCTIHPDNRYSLRNALLQGYTVQQKIEIYGSVRYLLQKNLKKSKKTC